MSLRIERGAAIGAAEYIEFTLLRQQMIRNWSEQMVPFDVLLMPTVPTIAPRIDDLKDEGEYGRANLLMLRNPTLVNVFDGCAITLPCHEAGHPPVGLTLVGTRDRDWKILGFAKSVERLFEA